MGVFIGMEGRISCSSPNGQHQKKLSICLFMLFETFIVLIIHINLMPFFLCSCVLIFLVFFSKLAINLKKCIFGKTSSGWKVSTCCCLVEVAHVWKWWFWNRDQWTTIKMLFQLWHVLNFEEFGFKVGPFVWWFELSIFSTSLPPCTNLLSPTWSSFPNYSTVQRNIANTKLMF